MSLKKELHKGFLKLTRQYKKRPKAQAPAEPAPVKAVYNMPMEMVITNILTEDDFAANRRFVEEMRRHPLPSKPQKILCFLPYGDAGAFLAGGYRTIMAINDALSQRFDATIYLCFFPEIADENLLQKFRNITAEHFPRLKYEIVPFNRVFELETDIAMCNFWLGAYPLVKYNRCRAKFMLVQDHESRFYPSGIIASLAEDTLDFGFYKLTNSEALKRYALYKDAKAPVFRYVPGIDHRLYYSPQNRNFEKDSYRIIFYGRPSIPRNAFDLAALICKNIKAELGDKVEIISAGENYDPDFYGLRGIVNNLGKLGSLQELAELYRSCDIGISLITTPTFSYQHLEFMASGMCLVTNSQEGVNDFLTDGENAVVGAPTPYILSRKIIELINNPQLMSKISHNALRLTEKLNWQDCFDSIARFMTTPEN